MSYRFQKFSIVYSSFARQLGDDFPADYAGALAQFEQTHYGSAYVRARHLAPHCAAAEDVFPTLAPLQHRWAQENSIAFNPATWERDLILARVKAFQPDVIYLENLYTFDLQLRQAIRAVCRHPVRLIGWRFSPTENPDDLQGLNLLLTGNRYFLDQFRAQGLRAELLPLAFDNTVLTQLNPPPPRDLPVTFLGIIGAADSWHMQRYGLINDLLATTPLEAWGETNEPPRRSPRGRLQARSLYWLNSGLRAVGIPDTTRQRWPVIRAGAGWYADPTQPSVKTRYPNRVHAPLFGHEYYRTLARSQITVNNHGDCAGTSAGNARLFEATSLGACLVTDWKSSLHELFEPDEEVVTYRNSAECRDKIRDLLINESECNQIAAAGRARAQREHTVTRRAEQLHIILETMLRRQTPAVAA